MQNKIKKIALMGLLIPSSLFSLSLDDAIQKALSGDEGELIREEYEVNREQVNEFVSYSLPKVSFNTYANYVDNSAEAQAAQMGFDLDDLFPPDPNSGQPTNTVDRLVGMNYGWGLTASQTLNFFRINSTSSMADVQREMISHQKDDKVEDLKLKVVENYWNALIAQEDLQLNQEIEKWQKEQFDNAQIRFEAGQVSKNDLAMIQAMYELTLAQKEMIQNNFDLSMAQLKNIIGMSDPVQLDPDLNYSVEDDQTLNASENKTYKMLLSQSNFNKQNADYEEAGFYPDVQLVGSIKNNLLGYDEEKFSVLEDYANPDFFNYSVGLQLNWSIFSGGNTSAKIKQLSTTSRLQERQASVMKLEIEAQLEVLLKNLKAISALIKAQETYSSSLKLNLESVRIEYQNGQSSLGDVVVSEKNYSEAKSNLLKHKKSWVISKLNADKLSGRPINGEL